MRTATRTRYVSALLIAGLLLSVSSAGAGPVQHPDFDRTWSRLDGPVASGNVHRTWFWGPSVISDFLEEHYLDAPGGKRLVIYFDKTRMELNERADADSIWRVTNGLLAWELITGKLQIGDTSFLDHLPPEINIAGDPDDLDGPTYRALNALLDAPHLPEGTVITQTVDRHGHVGHDDVYASYGVTAKHYVKKTGHTVASVFWDYMNSHGKIHEGGHERHGPLFENPYYGTGYPITEAYWTNIRVAGKKQPVLIQVFERRVLTYTPKNPAGWKVEAGNVGQHYWKWRIDLGDLSAHFETSGSTSSEECEQYSEYSSDGTTVKQSNSVSVTQSGDGNTTVTCSQHNITIQGR